MKEISQNLRLVKTSNLVFLLLAMLITACDQAPKPPKNLKTYVPFQSIGKCVEYEIVSFSPMQIEPTGQVFELAGKNPCDKAYCLTPVDQVRVNDWAYDMAEWGKLHCK